MPHLSPPTLTESEQKAILQATAVARGEHMIQSMRTSNSPTGLSSSTSRSRKANTGSPFVRPGGTRLLHRSFQVRNQSL